MKPSLRLPLAISIAAHIGLFGAVGLYVGLRRTPDRGASLISVNVLPQEAADAAPERRREARPAWSPREVSAPPVRVVRAPAESLRASGHAPLALPGPREHVEGPRFASPLQAIAVAPGPAATPRAMAQVPASVAVVEESVSVAPSAGPAHQEQADTQPETERADVSASLLTHCNPVYPRYCRIHGEEGTVIASVEIGADGKAGRVAVVVSSGHKRLDAAAVDALRTASYLPARRGGRSVASVKRIGVAFRLREAEEDDADE